MPNYPTGYSGNAWDPSIYHPGANGLPGLAPGATQDQLNNFNASMNAGHFQQGGGAPSQSYSPSNYGVGTSDSIRNQENKTKSSVNRMFSEYLGFQNNSQGNGGGGSGQGTPSLTPLQQSINDYQLLNSQNGSSIDDSKQMIQDQYNSAKSGIESGYQSQFGDLAEKQKSETAFNSTSLARMGGYLGGSANNIGHMQNLERLHQIEVSSLQSKMNAEIAQARTEMLKGSMELAKESRDRALQIQDKINERKDEFFKESMDLVKNERDQLSSDQDNYKFQSENLVPFIASHLGEDQAQNDQIIEETAASYGMDPNMLRANLAEYQNKQKMDQLKEYTPDIKNYNYAKQSGFDGTFAQYLKWEANLKDVAANGTGGDGSTGYAGVSPGDPIFFATAHLGGDKQEQRYIAQYADMKNKDPEAAQSYLNRLIYSGLPAAQKAEFMQYGTSLVVGSRALNSLQNFKGKEFGPYKAALESAKPFIELQKDQKFVQLVSQIQQSQAQVRRAFFGTAVTDGEKAAADGFLIDEHKDDLATAETKLRGLMQLANDHINLAFNVGLGNYSDIGGNDNPNAPKQTSGLLSGKPVSVGQTITKSSDKTKWKVTGIDSNGNAIVEKIK